MFNSNMPSLADIAAVTNNNDGFGGNNGWWILIILFALFGGWGNAGWGGYAGGSQGAADNYVLASDFATLQRQIDSARGSLETKLDSVNNGICSLGYDQLGQMNGINTNILTNSNLLQAQINDCCCQNREAIAQVRFDAATNACAIKTAVDQAAQNIMANDNNNYRSLHDELVAYQMSAKDDRIAELAAQVQALNLAASQTAQNAYIVNQLRPAPVPAYQVPSPYVTYQGCGCNSCCGV